MSFDRARFDMISMASGGLFPVLKTHGDWIRKSNPHAYEKKRLTSFSSSLSLSFWFWLFSWPLEPHLLPIFYVYHKFSNCANISAKFSAARNNFGGPGAEAEGTRIIPRSADPSFPLESRTTVTSPV
jgi:hypothetical protein